MCFEPEQKICPADGKPLKVQKTYTRTVKALGIGVFQAHQTILHCPKHPELGVWRSENLAKVVPAHCNVAYDVIVEIGRLRFLENRQVHEIETLLWDKHAIDISPSEIEYLIDRFIFYLAAVHQGSTELIKAQIEAQGGYILHLDSTCEGDSPKLASSIDSVSGFVLHSAKLHSENSEEIARFLGEIKSRFGTPHAVVSDMSKGIATATQEVFGHIAHYICHFHFLRAIGVSLLEREQLELRKTLSKAGISGELKSKVRKMAKSTTLDIDIETALTAPNELGKTAEATELLAYYLMLWILDHSSEGSSYGFPFDHRYLSFYERLQSAKSLLNEVKSYYPATTEKDKTIWKLFHLINSVAQDKALKRTVVQYKTKLAIFTDLRKAFRVAPEPMKNGLASIPVVASHKELQQIRKAVKAFTLSLDRQIENTSDSQLRKCLEKVKEQITENGEKLFADPFTVDVNGTKRVFYVHRTNNIMEHHFRQFNYACRRVHGNHSVRRNLQNAPEQLPVVVNLKNPNYIKLIFDSKTKIAERFSRIDVQTIREMSVEHQKQKATLCSRKTKRTLRNNTFKERLIQAFAVVAN